MSLHIKVLDNTVGGEADPQVVLYEHGEYRHPLALISGYEMDQLVKQWLAQKAPVAKVYAKGGGMTEEERDTLSRLLGEYGTDGMAQELASLCRERAADAEQVANGCGPLWEQEAARYEGHR